jgi:hypothetical protein
VSKPIVMYSNFGRFYNFLAHNEIETLVMTVTTVVQLRKCCRERTRVPRFCEVREVSDFLLV